MRIDLTNNFVLEMNKSHRKPIQLIVFHFESGDVFLSDRDLTIESQQYEGLVEDWGTLSTAGTGLNDIISETLELSISIWNGGSNPFSNHFLVEDPVDVVVDVYQTFENLTVEDHAHIGQFVIQDPIGFAESSRLLNLDLVSMNMRFTANIGSILRKEDWPNALAGDLNRGIDLIIGNAGVVQCLAAKVPLRATLKGSVLRVDNMLAFTYENLNEVGFPQRGWIIIDEELIYFNERTEFSIELTIRGSGITQEGRTFGEDHSDGTAIIEDISDHTYIIGQAPLTSVTNVRAGGLPVDVDDYFLNLEENPATIIFKKHPSFLNYPKGTRFIDLDFDSPTSNNTSFQPHYAYDPEERAKGALISEDYPILAIEQIDPQPDLGVIVRGYVSIEHWATDLIPNDFLGVYINNQFIGKLSRPNPQDVADFQAEFNINHGHDHRTGGTHDHGFDNPSISTYNPSHKHGADVAGAVVIDSPSTGLPYKITSGKYTDYVSKTFSFSSVSNVIGQSLSFKLYKAASSIGSVVQLSYGGRTIEWGEETTGTLTGVIAARYDDFTASVRIRNANSSSTSRTTVTVNEMILQTTPEGSIDYFKTGVDSSLSSNADVNLKSTDTTGSLIKDDDDVDDLNEENRLLEEITSTTSSRTLVERFEVTNNLETINWAFFQNKEIQVRYVGTANNANVIITYAKLEIEYQQREENLTNDITCEPVGSIESRPDKVIEYLLNSIAGVPLDIMGSIFNNPQTWNDDDVWNDDDTWIDAGEQISTPAGAVFEEAAARYEFLGYSIDGVFPAGETVQSAVKRICTQTRSRLIWSAGEVKLAVRGKSEEWVTVRNINKSLTQLKSVVVKKELVSKIRNSIDLFYKIDRLSDSDNEGKYLESVNAIDNVSITKHGENKDNSDWLFDLVRSDSMAVDLINYYIWRYGEAASLYSLVVYLQQFDIEKEDVIRLTSDFSKLNKLPMRVIENHRNFGSGKLKRINTINLTAESIRHKLILIELDSSVNVFDSVSIDFAGEQDETDNAIISEEFAFLDTKTEQDSISLSDQIELLMSFSESLSETVLTVEEFNFDLSMIIEDVLLISDDILVNQELGYGSGGYGQIPYGSRTIHIDRPVELLSVFDETELTMEYNLEVEDSVSVSDEINVSALLSDDITLSEELVFNSGYGCPIVGASGYGKSGYGK